MKEFLVACAKELKSPVTTHVAAASAGAVVVAAFHHREKSRLRTLVLGREAFVALVNNETNFVDFYNDEHAFRITLK